jgi:hypothetical protein
LTHTTFYQKLYNKSLRGTNEQLFAFMIQNLVHSQLNATFGSSLTIMKGEKLRKEKAFRMIKNHFMLGHLNHVISRFNSAGISKYLADFGAWYLSRNLADEVKDTRRILSLTDLEFGFVLFLAAAGVSLLVFFGELLWQQVWLKLRRKLKVLIGVFEFLRVLRARMRDYHDGW